MSDTYTPKRLELCLAHKQEERQSHYAPHNCDYCKLERELAEAVKWKEPRLARIQPCGCVVCCCEDEACCHGCGASNCGTHPVGKIPSPVYVDHPLIRELAEALVEYMKAWDAHFLPERTYYQARKALAAITQ